MACWTKINHFRWLEHPVANWTGGRWLASLGPQFDTSLGCVHHGSIPSIQKPWQLLTFAVGPLVISLSHPQGLMLSRHVAVAARPGLDTLRIQEEFYLCREASLQWSSRVVDCGNLLIWRQTMTRFGQIRTHHPLLHEESFVFSRSQVP